jgi:hypothetical protein
MGRGPVRDADPVLHPQSTRESLVPHPTDRARVMHRADAIDLLSWLTAAGLIALVEQGGPSRARIVLAFGFAFFVPGRAIVSNVPGLARWSTAAMPVVLSVAALAIVATITLWLRVWHPVGIFEIEAWLSLAGLAAGIARRHRRPSASPAEPMESSPRAGP